MPGRVRPDQGIHRYCLPDTAKGATPIRWDEFAAACPQIARMAEDRFAKDRLVRLGTIRADGSPRISPCEIEIVGDHLVLGMMWRSKKALDLLRDPRIVVHSVTCSPEGTDGDIKLYGRAAETSDDGLRRTYQDQVEAKLGWRPPDRSHVFVFDVESAGFVVFGDDSYGLTWSARSGLRRLKMPRDG